VGKVECMVYLQMFDEEGRSLTHTEVVVLDLDGDVEEQVFAAFPGAESFSWVELSELM